MRSGSSHVVTASSPQLTFRHGWAAMRSSRPCARVAIALVDAVLLNRIKLGAHVYGEWRGTESRCGANTRCGSTSSIPCGSTSAIPCGSTSSTPSGSTSPASEGSGSVDL